jgi:AraC-like DNA-binding protein
MDPSYPTQNWSQNLSGGGQIDRLFEYLPDVLFFAKDRAGRILRASRPFLQHCGAKSPLAVVGQTDAELFPRFMAAKFRADDLKVMETGQPLLNLLELFPNEHGTPQLHITNKFPTFDSEGNVAGVCGTVRIYENTQRTIQPYLDIQKAVDHIKKNFSQPLTVPQLAALVGFSVRHFERKFQAVFQTTPRTYLLKVRLLRAAELLSNTSQSITEIALGTGFYDHSSFTRQFRRHMQLTPNAYRRSRPAYGPHGALT